jgi:peptidoglycan hydrolase FlgJ
MTSRVDQASVYNNFSGLASLKHDAQAQSPETLREVAKQFESIFTRMMLKSMREANFGDSLLGSDQQSFYQGMFDDQLAVELSKGRGMGLADMLVKQLTQAGLAGQPTEAATTNGKDFPMPKAGDTAGRGSTQSFVPLNRAATDGMPLSLDGENAQDIALRYRAKVTNQADSRDTNNAPTYAIDAFPLDGVDAKSLSKLLNTARSLAPSAPGASERGAGSAVTPPVNAPTTWRPANKEEFIRDLWPAAQEAGKELGVDPRSLLAQAALESNWGRSMPRDAQGNASFNLFGIKAGDSWSGKATSANTLEVENGVAVKSRGRFRAYDSPLDSFRDYVALIRNNPRYAEALNTGTDTHAFASALQRGGYATDPAYAQKVASIAQNMAGSATALKYAAALPINTVTRTL